MGNEFGLDGTPLPVGDAPRRAISDWTSWPVIATGGFRRIYSSGKRSPRPRRPVAGPITYLDRFSADNRFNGVEMGFDMQTKSYRWSLDMAWKLKAWVTRFAEVLIEGRTNGLPVGGILALPSNMGTFAKLLRSSPVGPDARLRHYPTAESDPRLFVLLLEPSCTTR